MIYYNCASYISSCTDLRAKINAIDALIDAMLVKQLEYLENTDVNLSEYWLNDGQVQIKTSYNSPTALASTIAGLEKMKQIYVNRLQGRRMILRDIN